VFVDPMHLINLCLSISLILFHRTNSLLVAILGSFPPRCDRRPSKGLQTIYPRIYVQCQECFQFTLAAGRGIQRPPSPREMLKMSLSSLTSSSAFSLVGSSMVEDHNGFGGNSESGIVN